MKFTSKIVQIEAFEVLEIKEGKVLDLSEVGAKLNSKVSCGEHIPNVGDWVIKLSDDDIYLCPRSVFENKYIAEPIQP